MSDKEKVHSYQVTKSIISDHNLVEVQLDTNTQETLKIKTVNQDSEADSLRQINFYSKKANWKALNMELSEVNWNKLSECETVSEMVETFNKTCESLCRKYIPIRKDVKHKSEIPRDCKVLMRKRTKLTKKLLRHDTRQSVGLGIENQIEEIEIRDDREQIIRVMGNVQSQAQLSS